MNSEECRRADTGNRVLEFPWKGENIDCLETRSKEAEFGKSFYQFICELNHGQRSLANHSWSRMQLCK